MTVKGRIALVTGASRGIGAATLMTLARQGATVIGTATSESGAERIRQALKGEQLEGGAQVLNVTDPDNVTAVLKAINSEYGAPEILVNNAGVTRDGLMMRMKEEDWQDTLNANLSGAWRVSKAALRGMTRARRGRIINISSVVARMGNPGQTNYAASKAGLEGFTRSMAREIGARGITVNAVAPGFIATDMTHDLDESQREAMLAAVPLGRLGDPEEVAALVAFLASDQAGYISGETIQINGGMYMG
ncbi:MAG: 3-oxoacyl-ACP reductase FabG [Oleiphilaceae bacterium]|nr:3-oxoacyl-ACP reductase FabG [Oleiphilaceae bacterium]